MTYEAVIGLEVHAQLLTDSKLFCGCSTRYGAEPNSQTCPICLGLPGSLPVLNQKAVAYAVKMGRAVHCQIQPNSVFSRKNYFYPDLPKGYQISQYDRPLCTNGWLAIETDGEKRRKIGISRIHLEEDAGKSIHDAPAAGNGTLLDFNRCGVPLIEIVSEPHLRTPAEARLFLEKLRRILTYLRICDGNMEQGSLRCDANVSVRPANRRQLGVKTELKNLNSFRHLERALGYEIDRQTSLLKRGEKVLPETRLWDAERAVSRPMRRKEDAPDYRYFPEPDLLPLSLSPEWIARWAEEAVELPEARQQRFIRQYGLPVYDANLLTADPSVADYYEAVAALSRDKKLASNWIMSDVLHIIKEEGIPVSQFPVGPDRLAALLNLVTDGRISRTAAKMVFGEMRRRPDTPEEIVAEKGLALTQDRDAIARAVRDVLRENPEQVRQYRNGKTKLLSFFIGQVIKKTGGKADPVFLSEFIKNKLK